MLSDHAAGDDASFTALCKKHCWKRTAQRRAVFTYLCGNREHPTVDTVWRRVRTTVPDVSLDSVYRILDDFAGAGVIRRLEGAKVIRYDADTRPHEHFVCSRNLIRSDAGQFDKTRIIHYPFELSDSFQKFHARILIDLFGNDISPAER